MSPRPPAREPVTIREARPDDLEAVSRVFLACWIVSYGAVLPERVVGLFDERTALELWRGPLESPRPGTTGLVAEVRGRVYGITRLGADPDEPAAGHIFSLYVDPATQGLGVGGRLLGEAIERLEATGRTTVTLWVFAANEPARRFYARHGFLPDGGERVEAAFGEPEMRLRRRSPAAAGSSQG
jgi:ribosomal protein S18 acetylase RimI-like enzyme